MAGDAGANKRNSGTHTRVELTESAKRSEKDVERIRGMGKGAARNAAESVARRKRQNRRALDANKR